MVEGLERSEVSDRAPKSGSFRSERWLSIFGTLAFLNRNGGFFGSDYAKKKIPEKYQPWIEARKSYRLSHAHIQMARELGLNPKKFGGLANTKQEPWKLPLPEFIEELYFKHFKKSQPEHVRSI